MSLHADVERVRATRMAIEGLINDPTRLGPDFAPIRRLDDNSVVGFKATGRGAPGTDIADTLSLLANAQSTGLVERLDWSFRCHAFDVAVGAGLTSELHLTPEPETFGSLCPPRLTASWNRGRRALDVVAELHDDAFVGSSAEQPALRRATEEMRGWGWRFSMADLSDTPVAVDALEWIRPAYVQVSVARALSDRALSWIEAGRAVGASVMAVDVDSQVGKAVAVDLRADVVRGRLAGAPQGLLVA